MKKVFLSIAIASMLFGADVVIKTADTTASDNGLSVQNSDSTEIFAVEGNGAVVAPLGRISDKTGFVAPVGSLIMFISTTAPQGWLTCDGSAVSRTTYAELYALIGDSYGNGDGSTTFNLPDMRGKGAIGYKSDNTKFDAMGKTGGEEIHTLTKAEMPSHNHTGNTNYAGSHKHESAAGLESKAAAFGNSSSSNSYRIDLKSDSKTRPYTSSVGNHTHSLSINNTGGNEAHNVLDPYLVMNFIIKY